jgi:hypothetical protein
MRKPKDPFTPRNALERALVKAADNPAERGAFLRELLKSSVLVVGRVEGTSGGGTQSGVVPAGAGLALRHATLPDGRTVLPFFSSVEWLSGTLSEPADALTIPATSLFESTRGATLVLNLGAPWGKEFTPSEISQLLESGGANQQIVVKEATEVQIGLPAKEPSAYIKAITPIFRRYPGVEAAYLGWIHTPGEGTPPHLIVGVQGDGDIRGAMADAGAAWETPPGSTDLVDFMEAIPGADGISGWFVSEGRRFYSR